MTRIVSYNILAGGYNIRENNSRRAKQLTNIIRSVQPDLVGLVEATHPGIQQKPLVIEEMAEELDMQLIIGEKPVYHDFQIALLTRLPVIHVKSHVKRGVLNKPVLEVCVEEADGRHLTVFVIHLSAAFSRRRAGNHIREREIREILRITAPLREQGIPHLLMGDFNSLAPGDTLKASNLLRYLVELDRTRPKLAMSDGNPNLDFVVPPRLRFLNPLLRTIPRSDLLCALFDAAATFYAPRGCIRLLQDAEYADCYRLLHPQTSGFTCPAAAPAGRIDFLFADSILAERLEHCTEILEGEGTLGSEASDHLAVTATFGLDVPALPETTEEARSVSYAD